MDLPDIYILGWFENVSPIDINKNIILYWTIHINNLQLRGEGFGLKNRSLYHYKTFLKQYIKSQYLKTPRIKYCEFKIPKVRILINVLFKGKHRRFIIIISYGEYGRWTCLVNHPVYNNMHIIIYAYMQWDLIYWKKILNRLVM